jgi:hypothetical protein
MEKTQGHESKLVFVSGAKKITPINLITPTANVEKTSSTFAKESEIVKDC